MVVDSFGFALAKCAVPENIHTPHGRFFTLDPLPPWNFRSRRSLNTPPPPPPTPQEFPTFLFHLNRRPLRIYHENLFHRVKNRFQPQTNKQATSLLKIMKLSFIAAIRNLLISSFEVFILKLELRTIVKLRRRP